MLLNKHGCIVQLLKVAVLHERTFTKHFPTLLYLFVPPVIALDGNCRLHFLRSLSPLRVDARFVLTKGVLYHFGRLVELALLTICKRVILKSDSQLEPRPLLFCIGMLLRIRLSLVVYHFTAYSNDTLLSCL